MRITLFFTALTLFFSNPAWAQGPDPVADWIKKGFNPESALIITAPQKDPNGPIPRLYIQMTGARVSGMRIERIELSALNVSLAPPRKEKDHPRLESVDACDLTLTIDEKDANAFAAGRTFCDDKIDKAAVHFDNDSLDLTVSFHPDLKIFHPTWRINLSTAVEFKNKGELWLKPHSLDVNGMTTPRWVVQSLLNQIQPLIDLKNYNLPVAMARPSLKKGRAELRTVQLPKPFKGHERRYSRP